MYMYKSIGVVYTSNVVLCLRCIRLSSVLLLVVEVVAVIVCMRNANS
jgi:hypothetical protein